MSIKTKQSAVREQIIDTASRLFFYQGYNLTGINQIIAEAGVAKASLYQHFPSKEDLCVEYLQRRHNKWFEAMAEHLLTIDDPMKKVVATFDFRGNYTKQGGFGGCSFLKIISEVPQGSVKINTQVISQKSHLRHFYKGLVANLPGVPMDKAEELADQIFLLSEGATVMCQVYKDVWPMENAKQGAIQLLAHYVAV